MTAPSPSLGSRAVTATSDASRPPRLVLRFAIYSGVLLALAAGSILLYVRHSERGRAEQAATREARVIADSLLADRLGEEDFRAPRATRAPAPRSTGSSTSASCVDGVVRVELVDPRGRITYSTRPPADRDDGRRPRPRPQGARRHRRQLGRRQH